MLRGQLHVTAGQSAGVGGVGGAFHTSVERWEEMAEAAVPQMHMAPLCQRDQDEGAHAEPPTQSLLTIPNALASAPCLCVANGVMRSDCVPPSLICTT